MWGNAAYTLSLLACCPLLIDVRTTVPSHFARSSIWLLATLLRHCICSSKLPSVYITLLTCHRLPLASSTAGRLVGGFQRQPLNFRWIVVSALWVFESWTFRRGSSLFTCHVAQHGGSCHMFLYKGSRKIRSEPQGRCQNSCIAFAGCHFPIKTEAFFCCPK